MVYRCRLCHRAFATQFTLKRHVATLHPEEIHTITDDSSSARSSNDDASSYASYPANCEHVQQSGDGLAAGDGDDSVGSETDDDSDDDHTNNTASESDEDTGMDDEPYPWNELTDQVAALYHEKIQRRRRTYENEGYTQQDALAEAYIDFKDKMLMTVRDLVFQAIKRKDALDADDLYTAINEKYNKMLDKESIPGHDDAWKEAIKRRDYMLNEIVPTLQQFEEEDEEENANDTNIVS